jgi:hypothetical protein
MFEDGSAFKPIKIEQPTPENENGIIGGSGDPNNVVDYSKFDEHMENIIREKIEAKKSKMMNQPIQQNQPKTTIIDNDNIKIKQLEQRIQLLEQALGLVMETQTKMLRR